MVRMRHRLWGQAGCAPAARDRGSDHELTFWRPGEPGWRTRAGPGYPSHSPGRRPDGCRPSSMKTMMSLPLWARWSRPVRSWMKRFRAAELARANSFARRRLFPGEAHPTDDFAQSLCGEGEAEAPARPSLADTPRSSRPQGSEGTVWAAGESCRGHPRVGRRLTTEVVSRHQRGDKETQGDRPPWGGGLPQGRL